MPVTGRIKPEAATPNRSQERKKRTYNTTADSASLVRGDQEARKTNSLAWLRTTSQSPEKDQRWVEGVPSNWEEDMKEDKEGASVDEKEPQRDGEEEFEGVNPGYLSEPGGATIIMQEGPHFVVRRSRGLRS